MRRAIVALLFTLFLVSVVVSVNVQADFADDFALQWFDDLGTDSLGIAIGDADNDGNDNELVAVTKDNIYVLEWDKPSSSYDVAWSTSIDAQNSPVRKSVVIADADNDGLNDCEDNCPNQAGPRSNNGCAEQQQGPQFCLGTELIAVLVIFGGIFTRMKRK